MIRGGGGGGASDSSPGGVNGSDEVRGPGLSAGKHGEGDGDFPRRDPRANPPSSPSGAPVRSGGASMPRNQDLWAPPGPSGPFRQPKGEINECGGRPAAVKPVAPVAVKVGPPGS